MIFITQRQQKIISKKMSRMICLNWFQQPRPLVATMHRIPKKKNADHGSAQPSQLAKKNTVIQRNQVIVQETKSSILRKQAICAKIQQQENNQSNRMQQQRPFKKPHIDDPRHKERQNSKPQPNAKSYDELLQQHLQLKRKRESEADSTAKRSRIEDEYDENWQPNEESYMERMKEMNLYSFQKDCYELQIYGHVKVAGHWRNVRRM